MLSVEPELCPVGNNGLVGSFTNPFLFCTYLKLPALVKPSPNGVLSISSAFTYGE